MSINNLFTFVSHKTCLLLFIVFLRYTPCLSQSNVILTKVDTIIGKNLLIDHNIKAKKYLFLERLEQVFFDSTSNSLAISFRPTTKNGKYLKNEGSISLISLSDKDVKWTRKINYLQGGFRQRDSIILLGEKSMNHCLRIADGKTKWKIANSLIYLNTKQKIGIGYPFGFDHSIEGVDLTNGIPIWKRTVTSEYGWDNIITLNDSTIIIVAAGMHLINLKSGSGWDYNSITGKKDYRATTGANIAGAALGILTGTFLISTGYNLLSEISSNVLISDSSIYFASKERIVKLDFNGERKWTYDLSDEITSKSNLICTDSVIYMLNLGYAFYQNRKVDYGKPFIAAFDKRSGEKIYLTVLSDKKESIKNYEIEKDSVFIVFENKFVRCALRNGVSGSEKSIHTDNSVKMVRLLGSNIYLKTDSQYFSIGEDSLIKYVYLNNGETIVLNDKLETVNKIKNDQLVVATYQTEKFAFIRGENSWSVMNNSKRKIAEINSLGDVIMSNGKVYLVEENVIWELDSKDLSN